MAKLIVKGVESMRVEAMLRTVPPIYDVRGKAMLQDLSDPVVSLKELATCSGLAMGSPTHFGNMGAPLKSFLDNTTSLWMNAKLDMKPAGVFTSTSSMHGGQEATLLSMVLPLLHHGMIFCGLSYSDELRDTIAGGTPYGPSHYSGGASEDFDEKEKKLCMQLGERIATLSAKLSSR